MTRITILDTETGKKKNIDSAFSAYWWAEGNGSCDCNRAIEMSGANNSNTLPGGVGGGVV
ncbi:MAG: hypothetical protein GY938_27020 [Ketobacter sp.]|nr:hypothetical protein [Ketobacter sp.]